MQFSMRMTLTSCFSLLNFATICCDFFQFCKFFEFCDGYSRRCYRHNIFINNIHIELRCVCGCVCAHVCVNMWICKHCVWHVHWRCNFTRRLPSQHTSQYQKSCKIIEEKVVTYHSLCVHDSKFIIMHVLIISKKEREEPHMFVYVCVFCLNRMLILLL